MDKSYGKTAGADVILELHLSVGVIYAVFKGISAISLLQVFRNGEVAG